MFIPFRALLRGALRDRNTMIQSLIFPLALLFGLGYFFKETAYRQQALIGVAAFGTIIMGMAGAAFEVLKQRRQGVYKLLRATPYQTWAFIASLTLARSVVAFIPSLLIFAVGILAYQLPVSVAAVALLPLALAPAVLCFTFLGVMVGNLAADEAQVNAMNNLIFLPMTFGSEAFYSLAGAPEWLRTASRYLPMSHFLDGLRAAFTGDAGALLLPLLAVSGFTAVALLLAVITFRWDPSAPVRIRLPLH